MIWKDKGIYEYLVLIDRKIDRLIAYYNVDKIRQASKIKKGEK